jgi:regulator of cell morphogenesis and NO signaling
MTTSQSTLRSIALAQPATIRVFERYNLDYCCGGNRPLAQACAEKGLDVDAVLAGLADAANGNRPVPPDMSGATPTEIVRHIVTTHHMYVTSELARLLPMAQKVAAKHGPNHPELEELEAQLAQLADELLAHLWKEEIILFPYVVAQDASLRGNADAPHACFATVESPIAAMVQEHEGAGALLAAMRAATGGFTPPVGTCPTVAGLLEGLDAFERDLHRHIHLENNLLFPMAIEMEKRALVAR